MSIDEVLDKVASYNCKFVEITGGEPLEQPSVFSLMTKLCDGKYTVFLETGGHIDISTVDKRVHRIIDLKCPGSGMEKRNLYENLDMLTLNDEVKFVIADENDYTWAKQKVKEYNLASHCSAVLFSPVFGALENVTLSNWILRDRLPVRFQVQLHKYIWSPETRGV